MKNQIEVVENVIKVKKVRRSKPVDKQSFINSILTSGACTPVSRNTHLNIFKQFTDIIQRRFKLRLFNEEIMN